MIGRPLLIRATERRKVSSIRPSIRYPTFIRGLPPTRIIARPSAQCLINGHKVSDATLPKQQRMVPYFLNRFV